MSLTVTLRGLEVPKPFYGLYVYGHNKGRYAPIILEGAQSLWGWMGVVRRGADPPSPLQKIDQLAFFKQL
jgi:hypothetical protein